MHYNYYFLKALCQELNVQLQHLEILVCFSQNKDELVIGVGNATKEYYLRAIVQPDLLLFTPLPEYHRTRRNSIDLFPDIIGKTIIEVCVVRHDRSFYLLLSDNSKLLFKMHGNKANILLINANGQVEDKFNQHIESDDTLQIENLSAVFPTGKAHFEKTQNNLKKYNPLWGKITLDWLQENSPITWEKVVELEQQLENPTQFYVIDWQQEIHLSLFPLGKILHQSESAVLILQRFSAFFLRNYYLKAEKKEAVKSLQQRIAATEKYIATTFQKLAEVEQAVQPNEIADILMANLHQIPKGTESITLTNFYRNDEAITISLKRELTPQKNAENYYRKGKNRKKEIQQYYDNLMQKEQLLNDLKTHLSYVESCQEVKTLRNYLKQHQLSTQKEKETFVFPFKRCEVAGFEIWIGKSAANNDELTQRYAHKNDMWLHAKDVSGSHVVIKQKSGKPFTKEVIERAAELAAYYSKRKTDTLCPVSYTLKKYVRKPKGAAAGSVIVEKEDVILVQPKGLTT